MMDQLFRPEVIAKKRYRLSGEISLIQPALFRYLAILLVLVVTISLTFLALGQYTKKVRVHGVLQPNTGLLRLNSPKVGIVSNLLVSEGSQVVKGQPLVRIISEQHGVEGYELNDSLIDEKRQQLAINTQQIQQKKAKYTLEISALKSTKKSLTKRLTQLKVNMSIYKKRLFLSEEIVEQINQLANTGFISDLELNKQQDSLLVLEQQKYAIESEESDIKNQLEQLNNQLLQLPLVHRMEQNQLDTQRALLSSEINVIKQRKVGELRSPSNGVVTGIITKLGRFVDTKQSLMSILPEKSFLRAIIYIPTSSFGFIEANQKVNLRYHAFPYQRFGVFKGTIIEVSSNVILPSETDIPGIINTPSYRAVIELNNQSINAYGKKTNLRSGMQLEADIIVENRTLIRWLFDPIFSIKGKL